MMQQWATTRLTTVTLSHRQTLPLESIHSKHTVLSLVVILLNPTDYIVAFYNRACASESSALVPAIKPATLISDCQAWRR